MSRVQTAIFPAILVSIFVIVAVTAFIRKPTIVQAGSDTALAQVQPVIYKATSQPEVVAWPQESAPRTGGSVSIDGEDPPAQDEPLGDESAQQNSADSDTQGCSLSSQYASSVLQWCELIERYAGDHGLEASLVAALITQESGGDSQAYSHSGAVGLMQVMPRDGLAASFMCVAGPCFADRPSADELRDPEYNIQFGTRMLSGLLNKYGNIRDALLYYGPMNVGYYYADKVLGIYNTHQ